MFPNLLLGGNTMTTFEKIIFYFIIIQPLLDITTSIMTIMQIPITIGAVFRALLIGVLFILLSLFFIFKKMYHYFFIWLGSFLVIGITFIVNFLVKQPFFVFEEMTFILKTIYYVIFVFLALIAIKPNVNLYRTLRQAVPIVSIIIGVSFWIAFITKTNIASYTYDKTGYSGWFFSANELSGIVLILLGLTVAHLHQANNEKAFLDFVSLSLLLSMLPMIGTKTAFGGGIIILGVYAFCLLFLTKKDAIQARFKITYFIIVSLFFIFIPITPIISNTTSVQLNDNYLQLKQESNREYGINPVLNRLLSSRDIYLRENANDFFQSSMTRQLFGIGYGGNYMTEPKLIEMDLFDLLFSYGYIGFLMLIIPFMMLVFLTLIVKKSISIIILQLTILLLVAISFLAGHVLFAPSVMTYFIIVFVQVAQLGRIKLGEQQ